MGQAPDSVKELIERFDQQSDQVRSPDYNETQLRIDFVNPMFRALGWDIDNSSGFAKPRLPVDFKRHCSSIRIGKTSRLCETRHVYNLSKQVSFGYAVR